MDLHRHNWRIPYDFVSMCMSKNKNENSTNLFETTAYASAVETGAPNFEFESRCHKRGLDYIAGVDEAGRGPLAGPVLAAAVILDPDNIPAGLNDSKKLTEKRREDLFEDIISCSHFAWSAASAKEIDAVNIRQATLNAMTRSVFALPIIADHVLIDGRDIPILLNNFGTSIVKGDAISLSIAAASIIAKVMRDKMMKRADLEYPQYGFAGHKGYGAKKHIEAINKYGPCPLHRMTFAPMKNI